MEIPYDSLIVAAGADQSYFGHDEFALFAPGMKTIDDALELRRRIFGAFEMAEIATDAAEQREWLTIVIVGAGPDRRRDRGAGPRARVARAARRLPHLRSRDRCACCIVDGGEEPLATFGAQPVAGGGARAAQPRRRAADGRARHRRRRDRASTSDVRGRLDRAHRRPHRHLGRRRAGLAAGREARGGERAPRSTGPGASRCCPTSRCPGIPRCSRSAT